MNISDFCHGDEVSFGFVVDGGIKEESKGWISNNWAIRKGEIEGQVLIQVGETSSSGDHSIDFTFNILRDWAVDFGINLFNNDSLENPGKTVDNFSNKSTAKINIELLAVENEIEVLNLNLRNVLATNSGTTDGNKSV